MRVVRRSSAGRGRAAASSAFTSRAIACTCAAALLVALAACAGVSGSILIDLDASGAEVVRGAKAHVDVTLTRDGTGTPVTLTVAGLPATVVAAFSPPTLSGTNLTSTLTLSVAAAAEEGDYDLVVSGSGGGLSAKAEFELTVQSLTVSGRAVSALERPLAGASVSAQGVTVLTDADGAFTLSGLSVPYDLSIWNTTESWVHVFEGLTTDAPELGVASLNVATPSLRTTTIEGTLSGGVIPVGSDQDVMVCVEGLDGVAFGCDTVVSGESSYSLTAAWHDSETRQVTIHGLEATRDEGFPTEFPGYGTATLTVEDDVPATADLNLGAAIGTTTMHVTLEGTEVLAAVRVAPNLSMRVASFDIGSAETTVDVRMPVIPGASYTAAAASGGFRIGWQAGVTGTHATVTIPSGIELLGPEDGATGVTPSTIFSLDNPAGGPNTFVWYTSTGIVYAVTTMASSHALPDLEAFGMALPKATDFGWQVVSQPGSGADASMAAVPDLYRFVGLLTHLGSKGLPGTGGLTVSQTNNFSTAGQ